MRNLPPKDQCAYFIFIALSYKLENFTGDFKRDILYCASFQMAILIFIRKLLVDLIEANK